MDSISISNVKTVQLSPSVLAWARSFEAVVRCGSFTRAADDLCITQGAVSQQVKQFERWTRKPLLVRASRVVIPTPEGRWLATVLTDSLQAIETALVQIRSPDALSALMLSCSPSFAMRWLTPRLGDFYRCLPSVALKVTGEFSAMDAARMAANGLSAALRFDLGIYPDLTPREILDDYLVPVASPGFIAEHAEIVTPSDLRASVLLHDGEPWVGATAHAEWARWFDGVKVPSPQEGLDGGRQFNMSLLAIEAALSGQGIAMGRLALVLEDLLSGRLCAPFPQFVRSQASYYFLTSGHSPEAMEHVHEWLASQAEAFRQRRDRFIREAQTSNSC